MRLKRTLLGAIFTFIPTLILVGYMAGVQINQISNQPVTGLQKLSKTPLSLRDKSWNDKYLAEVPKSRFIVLNEKNLIGQDQHEYLSLQYAEANQGETFEKILERALKDGVGIAMNVQKNQQDFILHFGDLWSFQQEGVFYKISTIVTKDSMVTTYAMKEKTKILVVQPNKSIFPDFARNAFRKALLRMNPNALPGVCMLFVPGVPNDGPTLAFNIFKEDFSDMTRYKNTMQWLSWYFPRHYAFLTVPKTMLLSSQFAPL